MINTNRLRVLTTSKDGGPESHVWAYWLFAYKPCFSVGLLRFEHGTRDAFHSHAFDCVSWVLRGRLVETLTDGRVRRYYPSFKPVLTYRETFHRVRSIGRTWVLTVRGPWVDTWQEQINGRRLTLTHGREVKHG